ncbi:sodium-independent sulfate anion transporter [Achroia grisella]|uniref:sodium-independent sulfate anion transporter n=1 Tax=Achroia grisella TaxID=688607 RepID=UPI0027D24450|nr:sodium-independent sulfate anion transporter [Achroia grisella]
MEIIEETPYSKGESAWLRIARRRLPILEWARRYDRMAAVADLVAGVTLGLMLVPQSLAYASLAGLPLQYGLYSSYIGTILYVFVGTVKEVSIGPTSLMALLTLQTCRHLPLECVVLLTFLSGCVVLLMGVLRLGCLVQLISPSVTSGFTSATAVIIMASQVKGLLGLSFTAETLLENVQEIIARWNDIRLGDCLLGATCCTVLLVLRKLKDLKVSPKRLRLQKTLWLISISRNALVVTVAAIFAYCSYNPSKLLVKLSGYVEPGLPSLALPPFSVTSGNHTLSFSEMVHELGSGLLMIPFVMVLANIAIAKAFSGGGRVDATQEMLTLGLCNVVGALVHAMPTCGAFTRSAVSHSSGVRSPAAGLYSGIITLLALMFITPYFYYIPKACISSVLICAVMFMVDFDIVGRLWRTSKSELMVLVLTFVIGVTMTVELAVLAGAFANLAMLLRALMVPPLHLHTVKSGGGEWCAAAVCAPAMMLVYVNAEGVCRRALAAAARLAPAPLLLDCGRLARLDVSAAQILQRLAKKLKTTKQQLIIFNVSPEVAQGLECLQDIDKSAFRATTASEALAAAARPRDDEAGPLLADGPEHA